MDSHTLVDALMARARAWLADAPLPPLPDMHGPWASLAPMAALNAAANTLTDADARRRLDDAARRVLFGHLAEARRSRTEEAALAQVVEHLGPTDRWLRAFERFTSQRLARAVLITTWQCELRCTYCWIPKQDHRVMSHETVEQAVDLLLSTDKPAVNLQMFGGEPLIEWETVKHTIITAEDRAKARGKDIDFVLSSNGFTLRDDRLEWLSEHPVKLELSLDGDRATQTGFRRSNVPGADSYDRSIATAAQAIQTSGLGHEVIMVVQPRTAPQLAANFLHIADLGFERIQINFALGVRWSREAMSTFAEQLMTLARQLDERRSKGQTITLINAERAPLPVRLNGEVHVDWDGTIYGTNAFLYETPNKTDFQVGHLKELTGFDRIWMDAPDNDTLLERTYAPDITANNLAVGRIMASFVRWRQRGETS